MKQTQINLNNETHFSFRVSDKLRKYLKKLWTPPINNDADTIMKWLYDRGLILNYVRKLEYETIDDETILDEIQEIWLMVLEKKDYFKTLYDEQGITGLTAVISGLVHRQVHSNTSTVYNKYKRDYKRFIHVSEQTWNVFDATGEMMPTLDDYSTVENDLDNVKRKIETNLDIYE